MSTRGRLDGAIGLVTGGGRGVGRGIVLALAREGCRVAVNYFEEPELAEQTVKDVGAAGGEAMAVQGDVRREADVHRMVDSVVQRFGGLTLLVNNAGVQTWKPLLELTEAEWDLVVDTNLKGCFLGTRAAGRYMRDHGGGSIVNIGSGCNKTAFPRLSSYTASKGGIEMFTKVSAVELGPHGIRVNCIAPGAVEVERTKLEREDYAGTWAAVTPLGRVGYPDDIGRAVVLVASADAGFITGQTIWVDGGLFNQPPWPGNDV
jgi:NAD(P)-dependent dehydrogenase (short-subunit alcohol dehydrogenase family)